MSQVNIEVSPFYTADQPAKVDPNQTINNIISVKGNDYKAYTTYKDDGSSNIGTDVISSTDWVSGYIKVIKMRPYFLIGGNILLPQSSTTFKNKVVINYRSDYGVLAYNSKGESIKDSNKIFMGGTEWKTFDTLVDIPGFGWSYEVATDMFIPIKYMQGSGLVSA